MKQFWRLDERNTENLNEIDICLVCFIDATLNIDLNNFEFCCDYVQATANTSEKPISKQLNSLR